MVSDDGDEASTDGSAEVETSGTNTETQSTHREESSETTDSQSTTDGTRRDGGSAAGLFTCNESVPLIPDHDTGFQLCDDGALRRTEVVACPNLLPRDGVLLSVGFSVRGRSTARRLRTDGILRLRSSGR